MFSTKLGYRSCVLLGAIAIFATTICSAQDQSPTINVGTEATVLPSRISGGDLLQLSIIGAPEFDRDLRVSNSGNVSLPGGTEIKVDGLSIAEAERSVATQLAAAGYFVDPQVTILIKEYAVSGISVLGEVQKPGIYHLLGAHTLNDAISAAGGTTQKAGRTVTISHRNGQSDKVLLDNGPNAELTGNEAIQPGDTVIVSKAGMVYVVGDVRQPTGIVLENPNLTVLQAIAAAQGTNPTASLDKAAILRKGPNGIEQIPVPLKQILAAKIPDPTLLPEDVLFVPHSAAKSAARRSLDALIQTAVGVTIYGH